MTAAVSTGIENFALATVATGGPAPNASLIASDFIPKVPGRKPMRVRLPEGLPHDATLYLVKAIQSLSHLHQLESCWDGRTAEMLTDDACETAVRLLVSLAIPAPPTVQLVPLTDGGVQLEWHAGGNDVEIEVDAIGEVHAFISAPDGSDVLNQELPPSLISLIIPVIKRQLLRMSRLLSERT